MAKTDKLVAVVYADFDDARTPVDSWDDFILKMKWEGDRITVKSNEQKYKELQIAKLSVWNLTVKVSVEPSTSAEFHTGNGFSASLKGYEFIFFMTALYWQNFPNVHGVFYSLP